MFIFTFCVFCLFSAADIYIYISLNIYKVNVKYKNLKTFKVNLLTVFFSILRCFYFMFIY